MSEVKVVRDEQGNAIVIIPDIIFWNKQDIDWDAVKEYLKKYLGEIIENKQTKEKIEIGTKFADEYTGSKYSEHIRGARAKAKANAAQGIRELVESAANKIHSENKKSKHKKDAKGGWNYYTVRFALPVYDNNRKTEEYNVYKGRLVVNRTQDGKLYLYDLVEIKRKQVPHSRIQSKQVVKNCFLFI